MLSRVCSKATNLAAGLSFGLALWLPSGYSVGAVLLLLLGLYHWPALAHGKLPHAPAMRSWALTLCLMGAAWCMHAGDGGQSLLAALDRPAKYALLLLTLPALLAHPPSARALFLGASFGAIGAGLLALWQVLIQHHERAAGYTNAIQFGDLSLLLAAWSTAWALQRPDRPSRWLAGSGALLGLFASLASGSRGGWITLPLLLALVLWRSGPARARPGRARLLSAAGASVVLCLMLALLPPVQQRIELAIEEYGNHSLQVSETSVGSRLGMWRHAWSQARHHPWVGLGPAAYQEQQRKAVQQQRLPAGVLAFDHAHNEGLDMLVKRGVLGLLALLFFYFVPAWWFWLGLRHPDADRRTAALCGLVTVVGFVGFGATQVLFAHNSGNLMYVLAVSLFMSAAWPGQPRPVQDAAAGSA